MKKMLLILIVALAMSFNLNATESKDGMTIKQSANSVSVTMDRLEKVIKKKGITVFLRLDHSKGALGVGKNLRPTELLIFGSPKLGAPLMNANQTIGIDLPLKVVVYEDKAGKVWLAYNNPSYFAKRHHIDNRKKIFNKMSKVLNKFTNFAISK
ncbi:MAG: DUF302 domain-containing protein [Helicobacteraceae bacterium]|nr:DUF302 domain-containing protein [Helicobacteraceae bacterium]